MSNEKRPRPSIAVCCVVLVSIGLWAGGLLAQEKAPPPDPTKAEVPLSAKGGWNGTLVIDQGPVGIWACGTLKALALNGAPEIFGLDDKGRCIILWSYSGKWTPMQTVEDFEWMGDLVCDDIDGRWPSTEIYVGGKRGNLFTVRPHHLGGFDTALIARFPGQEIHTAVSGDLLPGRAGRELIVFTHTGDVYDIRPKAEPGVGFDAPKIARLSGRVRDAVLVKEKDKDRPSILAVCRSGEVLFLTMTDDGLDARPVLREEMGFGRVSLKPRGDGDPLVAYVTRDDGVILRLEQKDDGAFAREIIYAGPQGPRGIAAGRFFDDPTIESVAIFGYSSKVELLSRKSGGTWNVETIFEDRDKGHWLSTVELDGRNGTDEILGSGYSGRIFILSRPPAYGLKNVLPNAATPEPRKAGETGAVDGVGTDRKIPRLAVRASPSGLRELSTLTYRGGFETKTMIHETLVRRDARGAIVPGLAKSWTISNDGRRYAFKIRDGATFHDGSRVDAAAIALHFKRWIGLPEHAWIGMSERVRAVAASDANEVVFETDRPYSILEDLAVVNPGSIQAPSTRDPDGHFRKAVGSGAFALKSMSDDLRVLRLERAIGRDLPREIELHAFDGRSAKTALEALERGDIDAVMNGWHEDIPLDRLEALQKDERFRTDEVPGSSMTWLVMNGEKGPTANVGLRRFMAKSIDRDAIAKDADFGHSDPCDRLFARSIEIWPDPTVTLMATETLKPSTPLRLLVVEGSAREHRMADVLMKSLAPAGIGVEKIVLDAAAAAEAIAALDFDLRFVSSWGVPYDPDVSLRGLFVAPKSAPTAQSGRPVVADERIFRLVHESTTVTDPGERLKIYRSIQNIATEDALIITLVSRRRILVAKKDFPKVLLDHDIYRVEFPSTFRW